MASAHPGGRAHEALAPLGWLLAACAVGFAASAMFTWWLRWERGLFVGAYQALAGSLLVLFFSWRRIGVAELAARWRRGLLGAAIAGAFVVANVLAQPAARPLGGADLALGIFWLGIVYGTLDGLFLNVMPVLAFEGRKALGVAASIAVTVAYHAGFPEYHGAAMAAVVLGNTVMTLAYVLTGSPLAAVLAHVAMHVAAVLHGADATLQLPPHY